LSSVPATQWTAALIRCGVKADVADDGALHGATVQDGPDLVHRHLAQAQAVRVGDLAVADPQVVSRR
jgi:hypothetical protein